MHILETERLRLRWFDAAADAAFVLALVNDPDWIANIGDRELHTEADARAWITKRLVSAYWRDGLGLWAIERRCDRGVVGMCGFVDRDSLPAIDLGYALAPQYRGQGYVQEAARAALAYARDVLGARRVLAIVKPGNRASIRVLEALGMSAVGTHLLPGEAEADALFVWGEAAAPDAARSDGSTQDAEREIDAVAHRLFSFFANRDGACRVAAVPSLFTREALVTVIRPGSPHCIETLGMRDFVEPRAALLTSGRLVGFEEHETSSTTSIEGHLAHRTSRYAKAGMLDGRDYRGGGTKHLQLVRTVRGWRIAALAWQDDT